MSIRLGSGDKKTLSSAGRSRFLANAEAKRIDIIMQLNIRSIVLTGSDDCLVFRPFRSLFECNNKDVLILAK